MTTDPISSILSAELAAADSVTAAREQAERRRKEAEVDTRQVIAQAQTEAEKMAEKRKAEIFGSAAEEAAILRGQAQKDIELLQQHLAQRTEEAAVRIVDYLLP